MIRIILFFSLSFPFCYVSAIVDYTENEKGINRSLTAQEFSNSEASSSALKAFQTTLGYRQAKINTDENTSTVDFLDVSGHFQTNHIYFDLYYWTAKAQSQGFLKNEKAFQKGNPKGLVGINWFKTESTEQKTSIDIFLGGTLGEKKSALAFSRNDKHYGIKTIKYFGPVFLNIIYTHTETGRPKRKNEMGIGPIQSIEGVLYWERPRVSFALESGVYRVNPLEGDAFDEGRGHLRLKEKISFSYLGPYMIFKMRNRVHLKLGVVFKTQGSDDNSLISAKIYGLKGSYGDSFSVKLNYFL